MIYRLNNMNNNILKKGVVFREQHIGGKNVFQS